MEHKSVKEENKYEHNISVDENEIKVKKKENVHLIKKARSNEKVKLIYGGNKRRMNETSLPKGKRSPYPFASLQG